MSSSQSHRWQYTIIIGVAASIVISFFIWIDRTIGERGRLVSQMHETIESLATKCPPDMTKDEWETAIFWTNNLPGNCLLEKWADLDDLSRLQREFEVRVKGKVDMKLILWFWDEHAKLSPAGQQYTQRFRQVMLDEMLLSEPDRIASQIHKTISSLSTRCPPDMTKEQWEIAVSWTSKLPDKSMLPRSGSRSLFEMSRFRRELNDLSRLQSELEVRVKGKVDMKLILWIWDEHAKLTPAGQHYKKRFQKAMLDEMKQISEGAPYSPNS